MKQIIIIAILFSNLILSLEAQLSSASLNKLSARQIGPAVMSGRITAIDGVNSDPRTLYVGSAGGGVWKSTNAGVSFSSVFDKHPQSIGAIAINQINPEIVWVGTGECNMRNSVSIGKGIYQSIDGGDNWVCKGLEKTEHIAKIIINQKNPNSILVAAVGPLWSDSKERGLYQTNDGGKTWNNLLSNYISENTGCADVVVDPKNPNILYTSLWQVRRKPFAFISGGPKSALLKSNDGGKTWRKLINGLPSGEIGRVALAVAPSASNNLVAIVESKKTGLYISADYGESWNPQSADDNVTARPFYFSTIAIDPNDPKRVYRPAFNFSFSNDGGYSWNRSRGSGGWVHSDMHALWINPNNTSQMFLGTDGGVYISNDKGNDWGFVNTLPVSQAYHVHLDNNQPYNVYCGLQDNGSWKAASSSPGGVENKDWTNVGGGDGFWVQTDPRDNSIVYSESQGGNVYRNNLKINVGQFIQPQVLPGEEKLRWNWNTPIYVSQKEIERLYIGSQFLYLSINGGVKWDRISKDLTTNNPEKKKQEQSGGLTVDNTSAENHCTIFTITESPFDANEIWVGTDDGNLQVTRDNGINWVNLSTNYEQAAIPKGTWISSIEVSNFDKNVIYVTFDNHTYGDMSTYLAKSIDGGKTWIRLNSQILKGYSHKIKEDIVNPNILFLGTEWGLYVSVNKGVDWVQMKGNIPEYVAIRDITIDKKSNDLVLATHGRGILIVDDISPLRFLNKDITNKEISIIQTKPTPVSNGHFDNSWPTSGYVGDNSPESVVITYYLKERSNTEVKLEFFDANGKKVSEMPGTRRKGLNKVYWGMRGYPPKVAVGGAQTDWTANVGPLLQIGKYTLKLLIGDKKEESEIELIKDEINNISTDDANLQKE